MKTMEKLIDYYIVRRRVGHTTAMLDGAKSDKNILVIVADENQKNFIDLPREQMVSMGNIDRLRGLEKPILVDHYAFQIMFYELNKELHDKDKLVEELKSKLEEVINENKLR